MKTAEEIFHFEIPEYQWDSLYGKIGVDMKPSVISAMKAYAKQLAEQALKDAADNTYALNDPSSYQIEQAILSTPIKNP